ncbi:elongation factor 1-delta-like [Bolinopsis microptera]|uniref:elongation factor 1-delta-like n=1 Tax=Bolinopsis microptera TaxID=2820187 RepID=UPI00307B093E
MQLFGGLEGRVEKLEAENAHLFNVTNILAKRLAELEKCLDGQTVTAAVPVVDSKPAAKPAAKPAKKDDSDDDDFGFGSDSEEDTPKGESEMQKMKRLAAEKKVADAAAKKDAKPARVLKSNVVLDIKPWDDETDLGEMEKQVRSIAMQGLVWGDCKHVEIGFGIKKLRMSTCIVDEDVGLYDLEEKIEELEDFVQSVDIVSHNKI